jgi:TATA-binding protein-associated factor Taf7
MLISLSRTTENNGAAASDASQSPDKGKNKVGKEDTSMEEEDDDSEEESEEEEDDDDEDEEEASHSVASRFFFLANNASFRPTTLKRKSTPLPSEAGARVVSKSTTPAPKHLPKVCYVSLCLHCSHAISAGLTAQDIAGDDDDDEDVAMKED